jgi:hypothetical protein
MPLYDESYKIGLKNELRVFPYILDYFKRDIKHLKDDRFSKYDFSDAKYNYELKTRTNRKTSYPDTIIGFDKIENDNCGLILLFDFIDELCFIEYDKDIFDKFEVVPITRRDRNDGPKLHLKIPIEYLTTIKSWI